MQKSAIRIAAELQPESHFGARLIEAVYDHGDLFVIHPQEREHIRDSIGRLEALSSALFTLGIDRTQVRAGVVGLIIAPAGLVYAALSVVTLDAGPGARWDLFIVGHAATVIFGITAWWLISRSR